MNDTHWNTISNVYTLGQNRHIIYVQCPHTGIFVSPMGIYDNGIGITTVETIVFKLKVKKTAHYNNSNKLCYWCFTLYIFVSDLNL